MITKKTLTIGWAASGLAGFILIFLSLFGPSLLGLPVFLPAYLGLLWIDKIILIAVIILVLPPGILHHLKWRSENAVDRNLPNFLRDVANAQYTGMTFIRALEYSAEKDYGPLSEHLKWALAKVSWGIPYEEALQAMADHIGTPLVQRATMFVIEAGRAGGNIQETMESIAKYIRELEDLNRERLTTMKPNIYIVYVGFLVMIVTVVLVYNTFIVTLLTQEFGGGLGTFGPQTSPITQLMYLKIYFHTSAIVAFFGGLIAGQMGEDDATNGLKHSVIMMVITLATFTFFMA